MRLFEGYWKDKGASKPIRLGSQIAKNQQKRVGLADVGVEIGQIEQVWKCESELASIFLIFGLVFVQIEPGIPGLEFFVEHWLQNTTIALNP